MNTNTSRSLKLSPNAYVYKQKVSSYTKKTGRNQYYEYYDCCDDSRYQGSDPYSGVDWGDTDTWTDEACDQFRDD